MHTSPRRLLIALATVAIVLIACTPGAAPTNPPTTRPTDQPTEQPTTSPTATAPAGLNGRQFLSIKVTVDGDDHDLVQGTRISLRFEDGMLSVNAGCNNIFGQYSVDGDRILFAGGGMTEMGCDPPLHSQDDWIAAFLASGPTFTLAGNDLVLTSGDTTIMLLDRKVAEPDQPLIGPTWMLTSLISNDAVSSVPGGAFATIRFNADGTVAIQPGCNSAGGDYTVDGDTITFANLVTTDMACPGPRGQLEAAVMAVLSAESVTFSIDANSLTLTAGDEGLQFEAEIG